MKKVFLKWLKLTNFKGIPNLTIEFNERTIIQGRNRAGKSTVFDSFCWLLWGKDQFDRKDHEIKTLDSNNQPIRKLSHEVEGMFLINGVEERPKRIFKEIWTRPRGKKEEVFTGHETLYFWNDVPMKMSDFQAKIAGIISEGMFKLITNTLYFNALPWDKRRACLMDIAGEITNDQIFDKIATKDNNYSKLIKILNAGKTAAEYKKEIGAKKLKIKKELEDIPARIDEAERSKPESFDFDALELQIKEKESSITNIENILSDAAKAQQETQRALLQKQSNLHGLKTKLYQVRYGIQTGIENEQNGSQSKISQAESAIKDLTQTIESKLQTMTARVRSKDIHFTEITTLNDRLERLRDRYSLIDDEEFKFDDTACVCPTCKQMLQQNDIDKKKQELLGNFNDEKLRRLSDLVKQADAAKASIKAEENAILSINAQTEQLQKDIDALKAQLPDLTEKLNALKLVEQNKASFNLEMAVNAKLAVDPAAIELNAKIEALEREIKAETVLTQSDTNNEPLKQQKQTLQTELDGLRAQYANKLTLDRISQRISDLQRQEETLNQELADHECVEFEIMNYEKARMDILESRINSRFKMVSFKMFNRQINGGEEPACECLYKGVPYSSLNTEAKVNCGLDIINVLCDHYGVYAPVFIDNRESVTEIIETKSQIISLVVNPACDKLNVQAA